MLLREEVRYLGHLGETPNLAQGSEREMRTWLGLVTDLLNPLQKLATPISRMARIGRGVRADLRMLCTLRFITCAELLDMKLNFPQPLGDKLFSARLDSSPGESGN